MGKAKLMKDKKRIDLLLYEKGLCESREKAKLLVMEGKVYVENQKVYKASEVYKEDLKIEVRGKALPFVSRGGIKLDKAIKNFKISLKDKIAMDIGASTGGFTDCMLKNGAKKVYSVDVGYGQLDWKLRNDKRVVNLERTNARNLSKNEVPDNPDFASVDVSFISLKKVLPAICNLMNKNFEIVCLIKPQFEAGRDKVGKNGVVREKQTHIDVILDIINFCESNNLKILGLSFSPIKGPKGNIEYLIYLKPEEDKPEFNKQQTLEKIQNVVNLAHENLNIKKEDK